MIFLGFGKYVRADKIYALEPLARRAARPRRPHARLGRRHRRPDRRLADGARDRRRDGREPGRREPAIVDGALDLAQRVADAAEQGGSTSSTWAAGRGGCSSRPPARPSPRACSEQSPVADSPSSTGTCTRSRGR